ncbi:hypothetical protein ABKN59_010734 [Abortiporus biennis]
MSTLFCCTAREQYKPRTVVHESTLNSFVKWSKFPKQSICESDEATLRELNQNVDYVIELLRQIDFGSEESRRYFLVMKGPDEPFVEVMKEFVDAEGYKEAKSFKNFKCQKHTNWKLFKISTAQSSTRSRKRYVALNISLRDSSILKFSRCHRYDMFISLDTL